MSFAATDAANLVTKAWALDLEDGQFTSAPRTYVWASGRKSCLRAMALDLLHPEDRPKSAPDALERMRRGNERENSVVSRLLRIGPRSTPYFQVIGTQSRFEIKDRDGVVLIVGKYDGKLRFEGQRLPVVFEIKSGESVKRIETFDDFDRSTWTRHMPDQLLAYLLAEGLPYGLLILDKPGMPTLIPVTLEDHLDRAEGFLRDARVAIDCKQLLAPLPDFTQDRAECQRCDHYKKSCLPPADFGEGVQIITDEGLIEAAVIRLETERAHRDFELADKRLKAGLRGVENAIIGNVLMNGKWSPRKVTTYPEDVEPIVTTNPKGAFMVKFTDLTVTETEP